MRNSEHNFTRTSTSVSFEAWTGGSKVYSWTYAPTNSSNSISQLKMPAFINLWLDRGMAPDNGQEVEIVIRSFKFEPLQPPSTSPTLQSTPPTVKLSGKKYAVTTRNTACIKGTAGGSVTKVTYRLNRKNPARLATGTTTWTVRVKKLRLGRNSITVRTEGPGGVSIPVTRVINREE